MSKRSSAGSKPADVECVVRIVNKDGRTLIEIDLDEKARIALAARLVRGR
jgi:hypothetical protein